MARKLKEFDTLSPSHDARLGRGYGRTGKPSGAGTTWQEDDQFPYVDVLETSDEEEEEMEEMWDSPSDVMRFMSKLGTHFYGPHDPYGKRRARVDRRSFAHSSNKGLGENVAKGIAPFPGMYKKRGPSVGAKAPTAYKTGMGSYGGHGSKKGYFSAPPPMLSDVGEEAYTLEDILSVDDDERALAKASRTHQKLVDEFSDMFELEDQEGCDEE